MSEKTEEQKRVEQEQAELAYLQEGIAEMDGVYGKMVEALVADKMAKAKSYAALLKAQMKEDFGL